MALDPHASTALITAAREARSGTHAPYSGIKVGAALLLEDGRVVKGANVENASYGLTICAERAAIVAAVNSGARRFRAIAISIESDAPVDKASPCGACRQFMAEFMDDDAIVLMDGASVRTLGELLPDAFRI